MRIARTNQAKDGSDLLCIVGDTGRIMADALVMDSAVRAIELHGSARIAIIATKIDVSLIR